MTSAPSRLPQLSGSKILLIVLCAFITACTGTRKTATTGTTKEEGHLVYNPKTGEYERVRDPRSLIDTVKWKSDPDAAPPISANTPRAEGKKDVYAVSMFMPFNAQRYTYFQDDINPKTSRFLHYYCGSLMALDELKREGVHINVSVVDTREDLEETRRKLKDHEHADVIIGPYERSCLEAAADFAEKKQIPVISPWTPSFSLNRPSEYFVQITPGLANHAEATMAFIARNYRSPRVLIVGQNGGDTDSRVTLYRKAFNDQFGVSNGLEELKLPKSGYDFSEMDIGSMLKEKVPYVIIMPYYLHSDQEFINAVLRKLHAEKGASDVTVFGLPQWLQFGNINADYLESLNAHISAVQFADGDDPVYQQFAGDFYETYHTVPEPSAWQGYQLVLYVGRNLNRYGTGFLHDLAMVSEGGDFELRPVFEEGARPESNNKILYLQNDKINILMFKDYAYRKVQ